MRGLILKNLNEHMPDTIKKILSKFIRAKLINNDVFKKTMHELEYFDSLSEQEKERLHIKLVKEFIIYAYENTNYYKKLFNQIHFNPYSIESIDDLVKIPHINKEIVLENFDDLLSKENLDYYIASTGGSTGKPLKILLETASIYKEKAFVYHYWRKFGYDYKKSKIVTFRGLEFKGKLSKYNPIDNQIIMNPFKLNEENIEEYVRIIDKFNAEFFHGYASAIYNFCCLLRKKNIKMKSKIECVFFISENVDDFQKKFIEDILNCKTNIFYGHSERLVFAEYIDNSYEFHPLYTHVVFKPTGKDNIFNICCTGLINKKMPLINYMPDDIVYIKDNKIEIYGHWDKELLIGKNNEKISIASINFHNLVFEKIKLYQFEQFKEGIVQLNIIEDSKLSNQDLTEIKKILDNKLKDVIDVEINIVKELPLTKRGKFKKVIQHLEN